MAQARQHPTRDVRGYEWTDQHGQKSGRHLGRQEDFSTHRRQTVSVLTAHWERVFSIRCRSALALASPCSARSCKFAIIACLARSRVINWLAETPGIC